jgi:nucleoid DNA-binding protein
MKKPELARRLARRSRISEARAADRLDRVVHRIVSRLRRGEDASFPGLGRFRPGRRGRIEFQPDAADSSHKR